MRHEMHCTVVEVYMAQLHATRCPWLTGTSGLGLSFPWCVMMYIPLSWVSLLAPPSRCDCASSSIVRRPPANEFPALALRAPVEMSRMGHSLAL